MAKYSVGQRVRVNNVDYFMHGGTGTIASIFPSGTGELAAIVELDEVDEVPLTIPLRYTFSLNRLTRLDKTMTSTPNLGSHSTDAATWQQRISEALSARPGAPLLTLDEACDRIDILWQEASQS